MRYIFRLEIHATGFGDTDQLRLNEIARCLRRAGDQCEAGEHINSIFDSRGKTVGTYVLTQAQ